MGGGTSTVTVGCVFLCLVDECGQRQEINRHTPLPNQNIALVVDEFVFAGGQGKQGILEVA